MAIVGRYVFGRVATPKPIRILKNGTLSTAKNQDTSAAMYLAACHEHEVEIDQDFMQQLHDRDRRAWSSEVDWVMTGDSIQYALEETRAIGLRMKAETYASPRSVAACRLCDWKTLCRTDPTGDIENWFGVRDRSGDYSGAGKSYSVPGRQPLHHDRAFIVSPSQLRSYMMCPRQWYFSYKMNKEPARQEWSKISARTLGTLVHEGCDALAYAFSGCKDVGSFVPTQSVSDLILIARLRIDAKITELKQHIEALDEDFKASECASTAVRMFCLATRGLLCINEYEQRRIFRVPGTYMWVTCQPDLIGTDYDGNTVVLDYKTSSSQQLDTVSDNYLNHPAMFLYAHAYKAGLPVKEIEHGS